ncbi:MAG: type II secretion system protein GspM [Pseudomonadota bacterium]
MSSSIPRSLSELSTLFNERPVRERALLTVTALVLILLVGWELAVAPVLADNDRVRGQIDTLAVNQQRLLDQQQTLTAQLENDPSRELKRLLDTRRQRLARLDAEIAETTGRLIPPRDMVALLRTILAAQNKLELLGVSLKTPEPVYPEAPSGDEAAADAAEQAEPLLFAHDVEIVLSGSYLDVLGYLEQLERMDERLGWVQLEYDAGAYPDGEARIRVRTLSLERAWLGV